MCCEHEPLPLRVSDFGEEPLFELWVWPLTAARSEKSTSTIFPATRTALN